MGIISKIKSFFNFQSIELKIITVQNINFNSSNINGQYMIRTNVNAKILAITFTAFAEIEEKEFVIAKSQILAIPINLVAHTEIIENFSFELPHLGAQMAKINILNENEARKQNIHFRLLMAVDIEATTALFDPTINKYFDLE